MKKNLQKTLLNAITTDDSFKENDQFRIINNYNNLSENTQYQIDDIFISFCGYSLKTLIKDNERQRKTTKKNKK